MALTRADLPDDPEVLKSSGAHRRHSSSRRCASRSQCSSARSSVAPQNSRPRAAADASCGSRTWKYSSPLAPRTPCRLRRSRRQSLSVDRCPIICRASRSCTRARARVRTVAARFAPAGEDVAEILEWVPERYKVIRHVRPKFACKKCEKLVQAPAPSRPIARGLAGPGLLAHVLVSKYADHLPLYRQSQIFARDGIDLDRSTLADWVGGASELLSPLIEARAATCCRPRSSMPTTRRCRCCARGAARPSRGGFGLTYVMIDPLGARNRPRC